MFNGGFATKASVASKSWVEALVAAGITSDITGASTGVHTESPAGVISGSRFTVVYPQVAAADIAKAFFVAPAACKVVSGNERHVTIAGQAGVMSVEKLTSGEAAGAGDDLFATGFDMVGTTLVPVTDTAVTTAAGTLAIGDTLSLVLKSGSATSYALGTVTILMEWI